MTSGLQALVLLIFSSKTKALWQWWKTCSFNRYRCNDFVVFAFTLKSQKQNKDDNNYTHSELVKDSWSLRHDVVQKKSSKVPKKYLKRNGTPPSTLESWTKKSPRLLLSKQLYTTRENIANDSSTDSELSPSQLSVFTSPVPADILLDDDSERSHQIIKKQGLPPKIQRKRNAAIAPKDINKHGTYYQVINIFFDEKHRQDILDLGNTPTMCELDARKYPHKAVWDKLLDAYMDIYNDTVGSMAFKHTQFEYHRIHMITIPSLLICWIANNFQKLWNFEMCMTRSVQ